MEKEYYSITNKLYSLTDANHFDYAVTATLATFNYPFVSDDNEKTTEIKLQPFSVADIANRMRLSQKRNVKVNADKIKESIIKLAKADIITIDDVVKSDGRENTFIVKQVVDVKGQFTGFASINADEYFNIVLKIEKDAEKVKALACYVTSIILNMANKPDSIQLNTDVNDEYYQTISDGTAVNMFSALDFQKFRTRVFKKGTMELINLDTVEMNVKRKVDFV